MTCYLPKPMQFLELWQQSCNGEDKKPLTNFERVDIWVSVDLHDISSCMSTRLIMCVWEGNKPLVKLLLAGCVFYTYW